MNQLVSLITVLLMGSSAVAQTKPATPTPPKVVSLISDITDKRFEPDTAYAALSEEDQTLLSKEPVANWGLAQESGQFMTYYNPIIGTRSYQLLITKAPKAEFPTATLLRFVTPKSKPEPIARGTLKPKAEEKAK
ncbi:MAG: hypothetical protein JWP57_1811 [Spirosoma sp.]|nr:hypothetical protein [Spirosoma sp.]